MYKKIVINDTDHETRVALLEDETIVEVRAYLDSALVQKLIDETGG